LIGDAIGYLQDQIDDHAFDFKSISRMVNSIAEDEGFEFISKEGLMMCLFEAIQAVVLIRDLEGFYSFKDRRFV
jgi:hypothetical protein